MSCLLIGIEIGQCKLPTGYLVNEVDVEPQLDFRHQLGWEMVDNTLDEDTEYGGADGRWLEKRRGGA